jgi:hypothetical protein
MSIKYGSTYTFVIVQQNYYEIVKYSGQMLVHGTVRSYQKVRPSYIQRFWRFAARDEHCCYWAITLLAFLPAQQPCRPLWHGRLGCQRWELPHGRMSAYVYRLPLTQLRSRLLSCRLKTRRLTGDSRTTQLYVIFQSGDRHFGDPKHIRANCHKEFVNWLVLSPNCHLNI